METRIFYTRFWSDEYVIEIPLKMSHFFNYLITNERNNILGIYEIPKEIIRVQTKLSNREIQKYKEKLESDKKFIFHNSWVCIANSYKYQSYSGEKNNMAKLKLWNNVPEVLKNKIESTIPTFYRELINTLSESMKYSEKSEIRNKKLKRGGLGGKNHRDHTDL